MIEIKGIEKRYGEKILFLSCDLRLGVRDRLGLVGPNGSGKTTLFRIIAGEEQPDKGDIFIRRGARIGFLSQEPVPCKGFSLLEEVQAGSEILTLLENKMRLLEEEIADEKDPAVLEDLTRSYGQLEDKYAQHGGYSLELQAKGILFGLGFSEQDLMRKTAEFSGGWLTRVGIAKILLANPDLLLLDEPTNHLDLESMIWLEEFLAAYTGAVIVVSHDRDFLNRVATKIVAIENKKLIVYAGNYDSYVASLEKKQAIQEATLANQQKKIEQTERFIERFRYKATKARQVQSRVKMLDKMDTIDVLEQRKTIHFHFPQPRRSGKMVVEMQGVAKAYGAVQVYSGIDLSLFREDKVALIGVNGAGKSTLLKLLAGVLKPESGKITWGHQVTTGYFAQHQLELLDSTQTIWEEIFSLAKDEPVSFLRGILGAFLFSGGDVDKKVSVLSGGEKSRLVLAKMLLRPANFLLLDEPSNHLDIAARAVLERALREFKGTLCFITHDRHLMNAVANKIIEVNEGRLTVYPGNYDDFISQKEMDKKRVLKGAATASAMMAETKDTATRRNKEQKRREAEVRNRFYRDIQDLRRKIQDVETLLETANQDMEGLAHRLADPEVYRRNHNIAEMLKAHADAKKRIEKYTNQWEELSQELEKMEKEREAEMAALIA